jgi:hypothetical protein
VTLPSFSALACADGRDFVGALARFSSDFGRQGGSRWSNPHSARGAVFEVRPVFISGRLILAGRFAMGRLFLQHPFVQYF